MKLFINKIICFIIGHDWNDFALMDKEGNFYSACNRCFIEKEATK